MRGMVDAWATTVLAPRVKSAVRFGVLIFLLVAIGLFSAQWAGEARKAASLGDEVAMLTVKLRAARASTDGIAHAPESVLEVAEGEIERLQIELTAEEDAAAPTRILNAKREAALLACQQELEVLTEWHEGRTR